MNQDQPEVKMKILLAAKKLFAKQGFEGTTVRQICEEAGVNLALVSYHFGGKEKMFYAIFDEFFRTKELIGQIETIQNPAEGIKTLIREIILFRENDPELAAILQNEMTLQSQRSMGIRTYTYPLWLALRDMLAKGREQGIFSFHSLDYTLIFVMGTIIFSNCREFFKPLFAEGNRSKEDAVRDTTSFVLKGLGYSIGEE